MIQRLEKQTERKKENPVSRKPMIVNEKTNIIQHLLKLNHRRSMKTDPNHMKEESSLTASVLQGNVIVYGWRLSLCP